MHDQESRCSNNSLHLPRADALTHVATVVRKKLVAQQRLRSKRHTMVRQHAQDEVVVVPYRRIGTMVATGSVRRFEFRAAAQHGRPTAVTVASAVQVMLRIHHGFQHFACVSLLVNWIMRPATPPKSLRCIDSLCHNSLRNWTIRAGEFFGQLASVQYLTPTLNECIPIAGVTNIGNGRGCSGRQLHRL